MEQLELRRIREIVDEAQIIDLDEFNEFEIKQKIKKQILLFIDMKKSLEIHKKKK